MLFALILFSKHVRIFPLLIENSLRLKLCIFLIPETQVSLTGNLFKVRNGIQPSGISCSETVKVCSVGPNFSILSSFQKYLCFFHHTANILTVESTGFKEQLERIK